jgi:hypothetical protein
MKTMPKYFTCTATSKQLEGGGAAVSEKLNRPPPISKPPFAGYVGISVATYASHDTDPIRALLFRQTWVARWYVGILQTKNHNLDKLWRALQSNTLVYFYGHLFYLTFVLFGIFCGHLVYFMVIWNIFSHFGVFNDHLFYFTAIWYILCHLFYLTAIWYFCGYLVFLWPFWCTLHMIIWNIFRVLLRLLYQEKSGNPAAAPVFNLITRTRTIYVQRKFSTCTP